MVRIRLRRVGARGQPSYRVVAADKESPRDGRFLENLGTYNPRTEPATIILNEARIFHWLKNGAQPSDSVLQIMKTAGAWARWERFKQGEELETLLEEAAASKVDVDPRTRRDDLAQERKPKKKGAKAEKAEPAPEEDAAKEEPVAEEAESAPDEDKSEDKPKEEPVAEEKEPATDDEPSEDKPVAEEAEPTPDEKGQTPKTDDSVEEDDEVAKDEGEESTEEDKAKSVEKESSAGENATGSDSSEEGAVVPEDEEANDKPETEDE